MKDQPAKYRTEEDSLGKLQIPQSALWGIQTQRALNNFPVSGLSFPPEFITSLALIKRSAAEANASLKLIDPQLASAIIQAAEEVMAGNWDDQFRVDIFQTGSGTSTNMNVNEVIANRASEILGGTRGEKSPVHPNDHVNMGQSSNDVIPSAIHITAHSFLKKRLLPGLINLEKILAAKSRNFNSVIKLARTHLQDATPIRMGQVFSGYAAMIAAEVETIRKNTARLLELALGGTAVGTGINCHPRFANLTIKVINRLSAGRFKQTANHFAAQSSQFAVLQISSSLKTLAVSVHKIANDIRWMASGPRGGIGELVIPAIQPGSSIMPGKVNPVIPEAMLQVCAQVIGNDTVITQAGQLGNFELNTGQPVMAYNLFQSILLLADSIHIFIEKCLKKMTVNRKRCRQLLDQSLAMVTALVPIIGYDQAAAIAAEAQMTNKSVHQVVLDRGILSREQAKKLLDPRQLTTPSAGIKKQ
jgi:fumarate hydratase class II